MRKIILFLIILFFGACTKSGPIDAGEIRKEFDQDPARVLKLFNGKKMEITGITYMLMSSSDIPNIEVELSTGSLGGDLSKKPILIRLGDYKIPGKARVYISMNGTKVLVSCKEFKSQKNMPYFDDCDILNEQVYGPPLKTVYRKNKN